MKFRTYSVKAVHPLLSLEKNPLPASTKEEFIKQHLILFQGLGKLEVEYTIHLKEGATPFCVTTARQMPLPLTKKVEEEIEVMLQLDVIEPADEPAD